MYTLKIKEEEKEKFCVKEQELLSQHQDQGQNVKKKDKVTKVAQELLAHRHQDQDGRQGLRSSEHGLCARSERQGWPFFFDILEEEDGDVIKHVEDESVDISVYFKYVA